MRYWLLAISLVVSLIFHLACDGDGSGDGDGDADGGVDCVDSNEACDMSTDDRCPEDGDCRFCHNEKEVCLHHDCVCAFGREYEVEVLSAAIYARTATGNCWDGEAPDCEDPDPYAVFCFGDAVEGSGPECAGGTRFQTSTFENNNNPPWGEKFNVYVHPERIHTFYGAWIFDDDTGEDGEDDFIVGLDAWWWLDAEKLRQAGFRIEAGDAKAKNVLDFILTPLDR